MSLPRCSWQYGDSNEASSHAVEKRIKNRPVEGLNLIFRICLQPVQIGIEQEVFL